MTCSRACGQLPWVKQYARPELLACCSPGSPSCPRQRARRTPDMPKTTLREREIIALIDGGLSNKEIAVRLRIETQTVKNHVHNILEKFKVDGRRQLRQYMKEQGLQVTGECA